MAASAAIHGAVIISADADRENVRAFGLAARSGGNFRFVIFSMPPWMAAFAAMTLYCGLSVQFASWSFNLAK